MEVIGNILQPTKESLSQGLIVQQYCNSVLYQPSIDFSGVKSLNDIQTKANNYLMGAKEHAQSYLNYQIEIIRCLTNLKNYSALCASVPLVLPAGANEKDWIATLEALKVQTETYQKESHDVSTKLIGFSNSFSTDYGAFFEVLKDANNILYVDKGVLASLNEQIKSIDSKIDGCIAGSVLSAFTILGGALMIAIGGIADFVSAGTCTPLILGGLAVLALGTSGEIVSGVELAQFYKTKANLLQTQKHLQSESILLNGFCTTYEQLTNQAKKAADAVGQMANAWGFVSNNLGSMASDLKNGISTTGIIRDLFLKAAEGLIPGINNEINIIESQMAGVHEVKLEGISLVDYLNNQKRLRAA